MKLIIIQQLEYNGILWKDLKPEYEPHHMESAKKHFQQLEESHNVDKFRMIERTITEKTIAGG